MYRAYWAFIAGEEQWLDVQWLDDEGDPVDLDLIFEEITWSIRSKVYWHNATHANGLTFDLEEGIISLYLTAAETRLFYPDTYARMSLVVGGDFESDDGALMRGGVYIR